MTADRRSGEQIALLVSQGAECLPGPMLQSWSSAPGCALGERTQELIDSPPDMLIVATGYGLRLWIDRADSAGQGVALRNALSASSVFVRGPKAHGAAIAAGLDVEWCGTRATMDELLAHARSVGVVGRRVAVQLDGGSGYELVEALGDLGADVIPVPTYQRSLPVDRAAAEFLIRAIVDRKVDAVTFTARPAVDNFMELAHQLDLVEPVRVALRDHVSTFCVGPSCAQALAEHGLPAPAQPAVHRLGEMIACIVTAFDKRNTEVKIGGKAVQLQGRLVVVDGGEPAMLASRERELLEVLLDRPGAVLSKTAIMQEVWGSGESDTHVVEVTVGRLRRRLGPAGVGIETVVRRGYRASPT